MRIVHIVLDTAHGPLGFEDLASGGRGVTGSEQAMLYVAMNQAKVGHQVICYLPTDSDGFQHGVETLDVRRAWPRLRRLDSADVVISWLSADPLRKAPATALRIHSIQINDWFLNAAKFDDFVDAYVSVSKAHKAYLMTQPGAPVNSLDKFEIIPNGIDMGRFNGTRPRIKRRCVYLSSPDRGLHWVLAMWPEIRFAYPDAEFHIFYEIQQWLDSAMLLNSDVGLRANYVVKRLATLGPHAAGARGALSPAQLSSELLQADVMLYPCDPVRFTEGFGVAVLDACAAGVVPVITDVDALGEIYSESGALIVSRKDGAKWVDSYLESVLKLLGNQTELNQRREQVKLFAQRYDWENVAKMWEDMIQTRFERKRRTQQSIDSVVIASK